MTEEDIIYIAIQGLTIILMLSMPALLVASFVGVMVGLFQAVTQIQDQTFSFSIKLVATVSVLYGTSRWLGVELFNFAATVFDQIHTIQ
jgi:type III secretion protein S